MTITVTTTETRPNTTTVWYQPDMSYVSYIQKYNGTRTGTKGLFTLSPDGLTRTYTVIYTSAYDRGTFMADSVVVNELQVESTYNSNNGITSTRTVS